MSPDIVLLVFVSLAGAFIVIQFGRTRLRGVIPLVAGIGAAVFAYTRYSMFARLPRRPEGMFDSQITHLQYFWLGSILLWVLVAGWGLAGLLSSAPLSNRAGNLREHEKTVTPTPTDAEVANNDSGLTMDAWGLEDDVIVEKTVDPRSDVDLWPSELGRAQKWKLLIIRTLAGTVAGALGGGLIIALPFVLLVMGSRGEGAAWAGLYAIFLAAIGASVGAVAGGVTANITASKRAGAKLGALVGVATAVIVPVVLSIMSTMSSGATSGPRPGTDVSVLVGAAVLGAMAGAAAGLCGSVIAKHTAPASAADVHHERRGR